VDLKDDPERIAVYEAHHRKVWPEILQSLRDSGILSMEIYRVRNRMFMVMETRDDFSFSEKNRLDLANPRVREWEELMGQFQQSLPWEDPDDAWKWKPMDRIFAFHDPV